MEDALALYNKLRSGEVKRVLILVVMEDALAHIPYQYHSTPISLNPCCNGRCTRTHCERPFNTRRSVLILVVMEDALALLAIIELKGLEEVVLILVVMEDALAQGCRTT